MDKTLVECLQCNKQISGKSIAVEIVDKTGDVDYKCIEFLHYHCEDKWKKENLAYD